ncbi:unannotated protein [freshwater metagenome]|uniref:Unannotated protein n=1 Tax=freshwater metagenome TaxID=449393 RepID=A0A6J6RQK7_9ZZZZ
MVRKTGLHKQSSAALTPADNTSGTHKQCHRFFGCPISRSEKFLVEIKKGNNICVVNSVERGFGSHDDSGASSTCIGTSLGGELGDWFAHESFEFLSDTVHAGPQILHLRATALDAEQWSNSVAAETHKRSVISLHHCC